MHLVRLDGLRVHVNVPDLDGEVVARHQIAPVVAELDVGNTGNDLGEETAVERVFRLFEHYNTKTSDTQTANSYLRQDNRTSQRTFGMVITQRLLSHITQADRALAAAVDEHVALRRVELGRSDHLGQFFHVGGLDVHDI